MKTQTLACLVVLVASGSARAEPDGFLNIGAIGSFSAGHHSMAGIGLETTYTQIGENNHGVGGYVQAEIGSKYEEPKFDQRRYATGFHVLRGFLGVELGGLYRTAPGLKGAFGLQLGVFASVGIVSAELRAGISPSGPDEERRYGSDIGLVLSSKFPLQVRGKAHKVKDVKIIPCIWACRSN